MPSWRSRSIRRRVSSAALTIRARDPASSARASALAIAAAASSAKSVRRASVSAGSGVEEPASSTPHSRPSTTIGAPTAEWTPSRCM